MKGERRGKVVPDVFGVLEVPYRDRMGREYESVHVPWETACEILGRHHTGDVAEDSTIISYLVLMGYPDWLLECQEGYVDEYGVGYIGPALDVESRG